jgi:hypothetical protein
VAAERSPVVYVRLCASCAGYQNISTEDYVGALTGRCQGCGATAREMHRFPAFIHSADPCACTTSHARVTGDVRMPRG